MCYELPILGHLISEQILNCITLSLGGKLLLVEGGRFSLLSRAPLGTEFLLITFFALVIFEFSILKHAGFKIILMLKFHLLDNFFVATNFSPFSL